MKRPAAALQTVTEAAPRRKRRRTAPHPPVARTRSQHAQSALRVPRRQILRLGGALALGLHAGRPAAHPTSVEALAGLRPGSGNANVIRLASVRTLEDGGLLAPLIADFSRQTGTELAVYTGEDVYERARAGEADLVISHLGHDDARAFLSEGLGLWPRAVLFNQTVLLTHPADPANVRSAPDPVEAFRRIAGVQAPFIVNDSDGQRYLAETLWHLVGRPDQAGWYRDTGLRMLAAARAAATAGGYTLWGLTPFLVARQQADLNLEPIIFNDALVQRLMITVVGNPERLPQVNAAGALAFQQYLLDPTTQALIRNHRVKGIDQPLFWPAGRQNATDLLP